MAQKNAWHTMDTEQIAARLETDAAKGLTRKQALSRTKKLNIRQPQATKPLFLPEKKPLYRYVGKMLLDPIMILTLFVAAIAFFFGEYVLGGAVLLVMLCNAVCCALAYAKAQDVQNTLQLYSNPMIKVIRMGKLYVTDARNIVPGDVIVLSSGDICPADVRLEQGSSLRVSQYVLSTSGKKFFSRIAVQKSGDRMYYPDEAVYSPDCENIVYAGSVIEKGFARGIVVETGANTYVGAANGIVPDTQHEQEPDSISFIRKYFVRFSTVQAILLVPLTIVLTVTMQNTLSFAECFLTSLALCCTAIAEHAVALASIVRATGIDTAARQSENASVAIIKNSLAADRLCEMTDLLLFDSAAISDGKYHLESVYAGGNVYSLQELGNKDVYQLCSDLYLYRTAIRPPDRSDGDCFDAGLSGPIDALIRHVGVDTSAIDLTKQDGRMTYNDNECSVHAKLRQEDYEVIVTQSEEMLKRCTHVLSYEKVKEFDDSEHIALRTLCRIYRESGYRILIVANKKGNATTVVGVLAFAHRPGYEFDICCSELIDSGVRISVFMPHTAENMKILTDSGLVRDESNDVLTYTRACAEGLDLHVAYGSYRAYLGFDEDQIADLIARLKQRGNRIASYCVDHSYQSLHDMADLKITCDSIEYRSAKVAQSMYDKMPVDGKPFSARASQHTRRVSDIILRRAGDMGGGLHGILSGRKFAFSINHNLANMMTYLITVQFFRAVLVAIPAIFGTYTLSTVSLLISGMILDVAAVMLFAFATPSATAIASSYPILRRLEKPIAYNTANVVSACVSATLLWLGMALLQVFGVLSASECTGLSFVSTYLLQGVVFLVTLREYSEKKKKNNHSTVRFALIAVYLLLLTACIWLPGLNNLTGGADLRLISLAMTPFASLVYYAMYRILGAKGLNLHK